jgi:hypothetical protein
LTTTFGIPWLTGLIFFAGAVGTFVGAWTLIILFGHRHRGLGAEAGLILIVVFDLAVFTGGLCRYCLLLKQYLPRSRRGTPSASGPPHPLLDSGS